MFGSKKIEIAKEETKRELKRTMIAASSEKTLKSVKMDDGSVAVVQLVGIISTEQEEKGWYYNDPDRDTMVIRYLDGSWVRLNMLTEEFAKQIGVDAPINDCLEK